MIWPDFLRPESAFWHLFTRLGESQFLLPCAAATLVWVAARSRDYRIGMAWLLCLGSAVLVTAVTKIAFIGFGLGFAPLNFTGVSGHAMCAAGVYPLLCMIVGSTWTPWRRRALLVAAYALALAIAVSRVMVYAHSWSEVAAGFSMGAAASLLAMAWARMPRMVLPRWVPAALAVWLVLLVLVAPATRTHDLVTRLALKISGRPTPYTRRDMLRNERLQRYRETPSPPRAATPLTTSMALPDRFPPA